MSKEFNKNQKSMMDSNIKKVDARNMSVLPYDFYEGSAVVYNNEIHILGGGYGDYIAHYTTSNLLQAYYLKVTKI